MLCMVHAFETSWFCSTRPVWNIIRRLIKDTAESWDGYNCEFIFHTKSACIVATQTLCHSWLKGKWFGFTQVLESRLVVLLSLWWWSMIHFALTPILTKLGGSVGHCREGWGLLCSLMFCVEKCSRSIWTFQKIDLFCHRFLYPNQVKSTLTFL